MTSYDYKVVPAPRRARKVKGVKGADELFAHTLAEAINEIARQGWEYVRAESLTAEVPGGWFRRSVSSEQAVLVFRRAREALGPRIAAVPSAGAAGREPEFAGAGETIIAERAPERGHDRPVDRAVERVVVDRLQSTLRHQPVRLEPAFNDADEAPPSPLRPGPRLGPADQS